MFFELHNLDPIAKDNLHLTAARRGLMLRLRRREVAPSRVPLTADVAYNFVEHTEFIVSAPIPEYQYNFRALMLSVVNFMFFAGGLTSVSCRVRDVPVDDYNITLQVYREKGREVPTTYVYCSFQCRSIPALRVSYTTSSTTYSLPLCRDKLLGGHPKRAVQILDRRYNIGLALYNLSSCRCRPSRRHFLELTQPSQGSSVCR
eukprot:jgi/Tetstr1/435626/TSEL_024527.t1